MLHTLLQIPKCTGVGHASTSLLFPPAVLDGQLKKEEVTVGNIACGVNYCERIIMHAWLLAQAKQRSNEVI
jgi:hypothetical protein